MWRNVERKFCFDVKESCSYYCSDWDTQYFYYMGVGIVALLHVPLPGSVIGLLLLALSLNFKIIKVEYIQDGAGFLIGVLTLFFIPATVGVIDYPELFHQPAS